MRIPWRALALCTLTLVAHAASAQTVEYVHTDLLGSPVAMTDANGEVISRTEYAPYGEQLNRPVEDGPGFTGHVADATSGLTYMQQRYYDPQIGRFFSADPVTASTDPVTQFHRYRYGNNNPYKFRDLDGRRACSGALCDRYREIVRLCEMTCVSQGAGSRSPKKEKSADSYADLPPLPQRRYSEGPGLGRSVGESWERAWRPLPERQGWIDIHTEVARIIPIEVTVRETGNRGGLLGVAISSAINTALPDNLVQYRHTSVWGMQYQLGYRHVFLVVENGASVHTRDVQMGHGTIWVNEFEWRADPREPPVTRTDWEPQW